MATYAFRAVKALVFQDFPGMVGGVCGCFILFPPKCCSKCVEFSSRKRRQTGSTGSYIAIPYYCFYILEGYTYKNA